MKIQLTDKDKSRLKAVSLLWLGLLIVGIPFMVESGFFPVLVVTGETVAAIYCFAWAMHVAFEELS